MICSLYLVGRTGGHGLKLKPQRLKLDISRNYLKEGKAQDRSVGCIILVLVPLRSMLGGCQE